jgi:hypothetical protein
LEADRIEIGIDPADVERPERPVRRRVVKFLAPMSLSHTHFRATAVALLRRPEASA